MRIIDYLRQIKKYFSSYSPSIRVLIAKENILHNLEVYKRNYSDFEFAPVLKSNAYGHGLIQIAKILDKENLPFFVVDSLYEAKILKHNHIQTRILIIGYTLIENILNNKSTRIVYTISSLEALKILNEKVKRRIQIHLKIDTGMHRQGLLISELEQAIDILKNHKYLSLEGICSHLADADNKDSYFTKQQIIV